LTEQSSSSRVRAAVSERVLPATLPRGSQNDPCDLLDVSCPYSRRRIRQGAAGDGTQACREEDVPRSYTSLTLDDATRMVHAGQAAATRLGVAYNIAVVDAGGNLVAFARQDGALIGSIDLAIGKAVTARFFDKPTSLLAALAQPGAPLFGIQETNSGRVVIFGGGVPVMSDGITVGAVGASAGTIEQDIAVAEAAVAAFA
jgi:uncharacterized protein GlcG (DUF336 family)